MSATARIPSSDNGIRAAEHASARVPKVLSSIMETPRTSEGADSVEASCVSLTGAEPVPSGSDLIAELDDVSVTFRRGGADLPALRSANLQVHRGEILGLVGESGSGKTVLGLSLLGLLRASPPPRIEGSIRVLGVDMVRARESTRRALRRSSLGAIFQDPMTSVRPDHEGREATARGDGLRRGIRVTTGGGRHPGSQIALESVSARALRWSASTCNDCDGDSW